MSQFFQAGYECDTIKIVEMINDDQNTDAVRHIIKGIISSDKGHTTQADTLKFLNQQLNGRLSNYFNEKGQSPLFFDAILKGQEALIVSLLQYKINLNQTDPFMGNTALLLAVMNHIDLPTIKLLTTKENISLRNNERQSPLDAAKMREDTETVAFLESRSMSKHRFIGETQKNKASGPEVVSDLKNTFK